MSEEQAEQMPLDDEPDKRIDILISMIIGIGSILLFVETGSFADVQTGSTDPGAAYWPRVVLSIIVFACVINIASIYRSNKDADELSMPDMTIGDAIDAVKPSNISTEMKKYLISITLMVVYILLLPDLGFLLVTPMFFFLFLWTLHCHSMFKAAIYSIIITLFVFLLFRNVMNIALPYGTGIFRDVGVFVDGLV